jgi:hypothetical protein
MSNSFEPVSSADADLVKQVLTGDHSAFEVFLLGVRVRFYRMVEYSPRGEY